MTTLPVKVTSAPVATSYDWKAFDRIVDDVKSSVSEKSQRVYVDVLNKWAGWCERNNVHPLDMQPHNVTRFLIQDKVSFGTRRRELYILLKAIRFAAIRDEKTFKTIYSLLKETKPPKEGAAKSERHVRAMSIADANKALLAWRQETSRRGFIAIRAYTINAFLVATGLRCAEVADLHVNDLDLERKSLKVWHGKGDKKRDVLIAGEFAIKALRDWISLIGENRVYLFPVASKKKIGPDVRPTEKSIYRAVKRIEKLVGIKMHTHRWRHAHATLLARHGAPISYIRDQLGHASLDTTSTYTDPVDVQERLEYFNLGIGENL